MPGKRLASCGNMPQSGLVIVSYSAPAADNWVTSCVAVEPQGGRWQAGCPRLSPEPGVAKVSAVQGRRGSQKSRLAASAVNHLAERRSRAPGQPVPTLTTPPICQTEARSCRRRRAGSGVMKAPAGLVVADGRQRSGRSGPAVGSLRDDAVR